MAKKNITIQFGILANLSITNSHYLQDIDRLSRYWTKIDAHNYLMPMNREGYSTIEDMIDDAIKEVTDDAKWVKNFDGIGFCTDFYVVCYITYKNGNIVSMEKIKKLFF